MSTYALLICAPMLALTALAAVIDARSRRIPNWVTFTMILSGLAIAISGLGIVSTWQALGGMGVGFGLTIILFAVGALGGGDVKLLAGIGAWLGPEAALKVFVLEAIIGAIIVITQALAQGRFRKLLRNSAVLAVSMAHAGDLGMDHVRATGQSSRSIDRPLPYAVPVLIAVSLLLARSWR
jgi:prepilin peptidase CpaA